MFDYVKFKTSAYRNKYETAFQYGKKRVLYGELYEKVNAVYNSLCQMAISGTIAVFLRDIEQTVCLSLAASRAGICCVHADPFMPLDKAKKLAQEYNFDTVVLPSSELFRLGKLFVNNGCKRAVIIGKPQQEQVFSSEFYYDEFLKMNNYSLSATEEKNLSKHIFADNITTTVPDLSLYRLDDGIFVDVPMFLPAAAVIVCEILESGHKCVVLETGTPHTLKKQKIKVVITARTDEICGNDSSIDVIKVELPDGISCVDGGVFDSGYFSKKMSLMCNRQIKCEFSDGKIQSVVYLEPHEQITSVVGSPLALGLKTTATELFCAFKVDKTFIFRQKTN